MEYSVLILENNPSDTELIELQLRKLGLNITTRRVATEEMFRKTIVERRPDLVIADTSIPRFDIFAALELGRNTIPGVPWIVFAGPMTEEQIVEFFHAGALDFVSRKSYQRLGPAAKRLLERADTGSAPAAAATRASRKEDQGGDGHSCFYRHVLDHVSDLIAVVDREGRRVYNSPSYKDLLDEPEILMGTDSFLDIHPDDQELVRRVFRETLLTGNGQRIEYRLMDRSGINRTIESHGSVLPDENGEVSRIVIVSRDISERKRSRDILQALLAATANVSGQAFYRTVARDLAFAFGVRYALISRCIDDSCRRVRVLAYWADKDWLETFDYDVDGTVCESVLKDGRSAFHASGIQDRFPLENALVTMQAESYAGVPLIGASGRTVGHMFIMDTLPMSDDALPLGVMTLFAPRVAAEIERHYTTEHLVDVLERERLLLDSLEDAILVTDRNNIVTVINKRASLLTGYTVREAAGHFVFSFLTPGEDPAVIQERIGKREQGIEEMYQTEIRCKDGSTPTVEIHARPQSDARGKLIGSVVTIKAVVGNQKSVASDQ